LGNSAGSSLGEVPTALWLEAARVRVVGALLAPVRFGTPFRLGDFYDRTTSEMRALSPKIIMGDSR
jgi:hypothetical protein